MPKQIYNNFYPDDEDPEYRNINELYNKTSTTNEDWVPVRNDIEEWLKGKDGQTYRDEESKKLADQFVIDLVRNHEGTHLFEGLQGDSAVRNTLYYLLKRITYNKRRKSRKPDDSSTRSASTVSTTGPEVQGMQVVRSVRMDASVTLIRANYNGQSARLLLADIVDANAIQLETNALIQRITLPIFLRAMCEELDLDASDMVLEYTYHGDSTSTPMRGDPAVRAAVTDALSGEGPRPAFQIVRKSNATGGGSTSPVKSVTPSTGTRPDSNRDAGTAFTQGSKRTIEDRPEFQSESGVQKAAKKPKTSSHHSSTSPRLPPKDSRALRGPMETLEGPQYRQVLPLHSSNTNDHVANTAALSKPLSSNSLDTRSSDTSAADPMPGSKHLVSTTVGNDHTSMDAGDTQDPLSIGKEGDLLRDDGAKNPGSIDVDQDSMEVDETQVPGSIGKSRDSVPAGPVVDLTGDTDCIPNLMVTPYSVDLTGDTDCIPKLMVTPYRRNANLVYRRAILDNLKKGFADAREKCNEEATRREKSLVGYAGNTEEETGTQEELVCDATVEQMSEKLCSVWPSAATEHLNQGDNRWEDCCRLLLLDPEKNKDATIEAKIYGMTTAFYPFQVFGIFILLEMEMWQGGGYLADEMGLGKTLQSLGVIALNRALVMTIKAVKSAREKRRYDLHLREGTTENPQPADARCPSGNPYGIQCTCVDAGMSKLLVPSFGPNLIFSPAGLLPSWGTHIKKHFDEQAKGCNWEVRRAYGDSKLKHLAPKLSLDDYELMRPRETAPYFSEDNDSSNVIIFTTTGAYNGQVKHILVKTVAGTLKMGRTKGTPEQKTPLPVRWGRIIVDEVHKEHNSGSGTISRIREMNKNSAGQPPRKILVTGTPFETTPAHMAHWIELFEDDIWTSPPSPQPQYPRMNKQRQNLARCTKDALITLGKAHDRLVKAHQAGKLDPKDYEMHKDNMTIVVQTLWLRRTGDSNFMGYKLASIPANYHYECSLAYPGRYLDTFENAFTKLQKTVQVSYDKSVNDYESKNAARKPVIAAQTWLQAARLARIVSSFPELAHCRDTAKLNLSLKELRDNKWIQTERKKLYELARKDSPYEKCIKEIAGRNYCAKMYALELLMANRWGKDAKLVVMTMGPVSALILYWAFRKLWKRPVALIHSALSKARTADIVKLFQDGKDGPKSDHPDEVPQILVGTTTLINTGLTLTASIHVVIFDSEWLSRDEMQAIARVSRLGQDTETETIKFVNVSSKLDVAITDRQGARQEMYQSVTGTVEPKSYDDIRKAQEENILTEDLKEQGQPQYEEPDGYDDGGRLVAG